MKRRGVALVCVLMGCGSSERGAPSSSVAVLPEAGSPSGNEGPPAMSLVDAGPVTTYACGQGGADSCGPNDTCASQGYACLFDPFSCPDSGRCCLPINPQCIAAAQCAASECGNCCECDLPANACASQILGCGKTFDACRQTMIDCGTCPGEQVCSPYTLQGFQGGIHGMHCALLNAGDRGPDDAAASRDAGAD